MDPALKHRLIGAAVLSAVAVIFLPKLLVSHDTRSSAADVPLKPPSAPGDNFQTRELPLVMPAGNVPQGGVVGMDTNPPAPASSASPATSASAPAPIILPTTAAPVAKSASASATTPAVASTTAAPIPAADAGGRFVVSLGTYGNAANAQALVASLKKAALPAYSESVSVGGKTQQRVRIGPFPQRGDAEAARLKAQQVRTDMPATVIALDAAAPAPEIPAPANKPAAAIAAPAAKPAAPVAATKPIAQAAPVAAKSTPGAMDISAAAAKPAAPSPAAAGRGYVVQLVAFRAEAEALALRDKLRAAGFTAYSERVQAESGVLFRVRVGPQADRAAADKLRAEVAAKFGLTGMVVAYP